MCGSIPRRALGMFVVIAAVYDAYSVPLSAVHILWSLSADSYGGKCCQLPVGARTIRLYGQVPN